MTTHTPGPWTVNRVKSCNARDAWIGGAEHGKSGFQQEVADIYTHHSHGDANARLIAAAPDLLAACKKLLSYGFNDDQGGLMAAAAIAKAEGRDLTP